MTATWKTSFAITGLGLRCAVGQGVVQSCAAIRAGVGRFSEWPHMALSHDGEEGSIIAASVVPDLGDRSWIEKLGGLATQPLLEALWMADLAHLTDPGAATRWALFLATPAPDRVGVEAEDAAGFADDLKEGTLFPVAPQATSIHARGHAGALLALRQAMAELVEGRWDVCVVGGVDSLLESELISLAIGEKKLKTAASTSGYIPGEAAAFVVLEAADHARQRGAKILAHLTPVRTAQETAPAYAEAPGRAEGVAAVLRQSVADAPCGPTGLQRIINDLNGERWRFLEWAMADGRVLSKLPPYWRLWHPADCFGDIGAATGAAHLCVAVRAFERSYAVGEAIIVCNSSEAGERASTVVYPATAEA